MATTPRPGDANYGTAPEGSLSEERAKKAALWVEKEVFKLLGEIEGLGRHNGNEVHVTFGELFVHYQDVSDTLVGIMARAKKRGLLKYEGQGGHMLFQGKHDSVLITLDKAKSAQWRKEYQSGTLSSEMETKSSSSGPKKLTVKEQYEEEKKRKSAGAVLTTTTSTSAPTPPPKPALTQESPPPAAASAKPQPVETSSHSGFLASMMGKLLPSPQGSDAAPSPVPTLSVEAKKPEPVDNSSLTRSIMASVSRLLPSRESASDIGDDVLNAVRISAQKARTQQQQPSPSPSPTPSRSPSPAPTATPMSTTATPSPTTTASKQPAEQSHHVVHAALPQRTRDGTRGAVLKTPPSTPPAPAPKSPTRPVSVTKAQAPQAPVSSATLKREQEEWAKKHVSRGVVTSTPVSTTPAATTTTTTSLKSATLPKNGTSAYAKLAAFQDPPAPKPTSSANNGTANTSTYAKLAPFQENKHKSVPASSNVSKKTDVFEKAKQSSTLPTGLQKRFAWE